MPVDFNKLWDSYPLAERSAFFSELGPAWPPLLNNDAYANTCALRFSVAMIAAGHPPPPALVASDGGLKTGRGEGVLIRVASVKAWLTQLLGPSTWGTTKTIGADVDRLLPAYTGILLYLVPGGRDASGHVDIWKKTVCRNDIHSSFARSATNVEVWQLA